MIRIPYKAVYCLLETYYIRKSLDGYIADYVITPDIFQASLLMAHTLEDYKYLDVMVTKRTELSEEFVLFIKDGDFPLTIQSFRDLSLTEFAILFHKTYIDIERFVEVIESACANRSYEQPDTDKEISLFRNHVEFIRANN